MSDPTMSTSQTTSSPLSSLGVPTFTPVARAILRIGAGLLFMQHGAQKLFGLFGGVDGAGASAELFSQFGVAGVLEFFGGALFVAGFFTRSVAAVLALLMIVAYFIAHAPQGFVPVMNGGELALLYALVFIFFAGSTPGAWSIDGARS